MEREATLLVLALAICGPLCVLFGVMARPLQRLDASGRHVERLAWRRLWLPLAPAGFALLVLIGWAAQEPDETDDGVATALMLAAIPGAIIGSRAVARAALSAARRIKPLAGTVGLVRPRVIIDPLLEDTLDGEALVAVLAHESSHARHRDPLRILLAQLATDLQWPASSATARFHHWLHALELARDEEARDDGADGDALADAIVTVAKLARRTPYRFDVCASLTGHGEMLRDRVSRLMNPPLADTRRAGRRWPLAILTVALLAIAIGLLGGDRLVRHLPGVF
ncbi:MAG TPA: M48 family metalloprotease [Kofleriaceae bacterium]